jgi:hypothetical protein
MLVVILYEVIEVHDNYCSFLAPLIIMYGKNFFMDLRGVLRDISRGGRFNVSNFVVFLCGEGVDKST